MLLLFTPAAPTQHALTPPSTSTDPGTARMAAAARADALRTTVYSGFPGNSTPPAGYMPEPGDPSVKSGGGSNGWVSGDENVTGNVMNSDEGVSMQQASDAPSATSLPAYTSRSIACTGTPVFADSAAPCDNRDAAEKE